MYPTLMRMLAAEREADVVRASRKRQLAHLVMRSSFARRATPGGAAPCCA